jgi:hypothetical protein
LRAHLVSGAFWTLSAWADEAALRQFPVPTQLRTVMKIAQPWMKSATFQFCRCRLAR